MLHLGATASPLRPGDHGCLIYDTPAEQLEVAAAYIRAGLDAGERCVYLVGDRQLVDVVEALHRGGVDVAREVSEGALQFDTVARTYLPGGVFDPASMIGTIRRKRADAIAGGYTGLRAAGEMGWAAEASVTLVEYERRVNAEVFPLGRVTGLCQYQRAQFAWSELTDLLAVHPVVLCPASAASAGARADAGPYSRAPLPEGR